MPNSKISRTTPEAQGESAWAPPTGTLGELVAKARDRAVQLAGISLSQVRESRRSVPSLELALRGSSVAVIAEVKRSSPSKGVIDASIDSGARAAEYERGGAAAVSVLTEPDRFSGRDEDIAEVRSRSSLPVLKKDFHVDPNQILHAAELGASAALVIVRAIEPSALHEFASAARDARIDLLFEIRDERELDYALDVDARLIGVNNRNLETLHIDPTTVERIIPLIPADRIAVAESGYSSREEVERAAHAGADAVLIGSSLSASGNATAAVRALTGIPRIKRSR